MKTNMLQLFAPGDTIYGFCNGFFGRDDFETKTCVMVTPLYAVFQNGQGFATVLNWEERLNQVDTERWKQDG